MIKSVPQGLKSVCENSIPKLSPEGTAELSPGRSPGVCMHHGKVPQGRLERSSRLGPEFVRLIGNYQSPNTSRFPVDFQSSLWDFSSLESLPRTASWAAGDKSPAYPTPPGRVNLRGDHGKKNGAQDRAAHGVIAKTERVAGRHDEPYG